MPKSESKDSFFHFMGYKTLYIRDSEKLRLYLDNLVVETPKGELRFLISDLKYLIIDNYKTVMSTQLINKLTENNVALVLCDLSHLPTTQLIPLNGHYASSSVIKKQIEWNKELKQLIHAEIIKEKIQSQIEILRLNHKNQAVIERMKEFKNEVDISDSGNREGLAAKMYFRELFDKDFIRFDDDITNAGLNYGYAVFRSLISSIIVSKGLLLNLGIFHRGPSNQFNLADDIIEIYRPLVDNYVYNNLLHEKILTKEHRENLIKLTDLKIEYNGQMHTITNTIEMYIESIIRCFDNNSIDDLCIPSLKRINDL